ncbi:MAG: hypothetical protein WC718_01510 [Phycisphaerales bacterium]|jgi:hypothetical protein
MTANYIHEDRSVFRYRHSLGLYWVTEDCPREYDGEHDVVEHGPFMDLLDAYAQCGKPDVWINA